MSQARLPSTRDVWDNGAREPHRRFKAPEKTDFGDLATLASSKGVGSGVPSSLAHDRVRRGTGLELTPVEHKPKMAKQQEIRVTPAEAARSYLAIQRAILVGTRSGNRSHRSASRPDRSRRGYSLYPRGSWNWQISAARGGQKSSAGTRHRRTRHDGRSRRNPFGFRRAPAGIASTYEGGKVFTYSSTVRLAQCIWHGQRNRRSAGHLAGCACNAYTFDRRRKSQANPAGG
jgi:hypothetical protein